MCCGVLWCVAVCCSVLQCVVDRHDTSRRPTTHCNTLLCVAVCYIMVQCVAVSCRVLQKERIQTVCCGVLWYVTVCCSELQRVAESDNTNKRQGKSDMPK